MRTVMLLLHASLCSDIRAGDDTLPGACYGKQVFDTSRTRLTLPSPMLFCYFLKMQPAMVWPSASLCSGIRAGDNTLPGSYNGKQVFDTSRTRLTLPSPVLFCYSLKMQPAIGMAKRISVQWHQGWRRHTAWFMFSQAHF
jgi:hypothetical protein